MKHSHRSLLILLASGVLAGSALGADQHAGEAQFALCQSCHGPSAQGMEATGAPRLAGQHAWYVERQLGNFRAGVRGVHELDEWGQSMRMMAAMLPDDEAVANVAAYIQGLEAASPAATAAGGDAVRGKDLFATCQACHGEKGAGLEARGAPRIAGQHDWYLVRQLTNFRAGIRGTHEADEWGQSMQMMSGMLADDQAVKDVAAHISALQ